MISVYEAESIILNSIPKMPKGKMETRKALYEVLAEGLRADRDFPPFNRVAMDGIAINSEHFSSGVQFPIQSLQRAGDPIGKLESPEYCMEVMTGTGLPSGCDSVIPYEQISITDGKASTLIESVSAWQNIHRQGSDQRQGDIVLPAGSRLGPAELAIAAAIGQEQLAVYRRPHIALVSTGDELVDIANIPESHQIRRSNEYAIDAALRQNGFGDITWHHCADDEQGLKTTIIQLMESADVLIFSGGVSAGKFDLLPQVLADLGVETQFHKISQRPGKPMYYGLHHRQKAIFGLPGNPVSALITFYRYVLPALKHSIGNQLPTQIFARLGEDISFPKAMTLFRAVRLKISKDGSIWAEPMANNGSGDFISLRGSDGFVELSAKQEHFAKASLHPLWLWNANHF